MLRHVVRGDSWNDDDSPLNAVGLGIKDGDRVVAIDGQELGETGPGELLVHRGGIEVDLTVQRGKETPRVVTVKPMRNEELARYREWVEVTRRRVHEATDGAVGYVHIPVRSITMPRGAAPGP